MAEGDLKRLMKDAESTWLTEIEQTISEAEISDQIEFDFPTSKVSKGVKVLDDYNAILALKVDLGVGVKCYYGYLHGSSGKWVTKKELKDGKTWVVSKENISMASIYKFVQITINLENVQTSKTGKEIHIKLTFFPNDDFDSADFSGMDNEQATANVSQHSGTSPTIMTDQEVRSQQVLPPSPVDVPPPQQDEDSMVLEGDFDLELDHEDFLQYEVDYEYLNEVEWPQSGFLFKFDPQDAERVIYQSPDGCPKLYKTDRNDILLSKVTAEAEREVACNKHARSKKWQFDPDFDYFLAPLDRNLWNKVYVETHFKANVELLYQHKLRTLSDADLASIDHKKLLEKVTARVHKHFGFMEIFKKPKNGDKYQMTGDFHINISKIESYLIFKLQLSYFCKIFCNICVR